MVSRIINFILIALFTFAIAPRLPNSEIAFTPLTAEAATVKSDAGNKARQAAQEAVKDTGAKEIFGKTENGDELIDKAQAEASKKLTKLSQKADSNEELPDTEKRFLDNISP